MGDDDSYESQTRTPESQHHQESGGGHISHLHDIASLEVPLLGQSSTRTHRDRSNGLSSGLWILFFINGFTLACCTTALLSIVNDRAKIPITLMASYASIAFLPASLKPIYGYLSTIIPQHFQERNMILPMLYALSALTYAATQWCIPTNGISLCFLFAFLRSFFSAWPEFLLFLRVLEDASTSGSSAVVYQSQAATARSLGSLVAESVSLALYAFIEHSSVANAITLYLSSLGNLVSAGVAIVMIMKAEPVVHCHHENHHHTADSERRLQDNAGYEVVSENAVPEAVSLNDNTDIGDSPTTSASNYPSLTPAIFLLQTTSILFTMKTPFIQGTSQLAFEFLVLLSLLSLGHLVWSSGHGYNVGFFLVLRQAIPTVSYVRESLQYQVFHSLSASYMVPLLSIVSMVVLAAASWSFGRFLQPFGDGRYGMVWLLGGGTVLSTLALLGTSWLIPLLRVSTGWLLVVVSALILQIVLGFTSEYRFLPGVVLATKESGGDPVLFGALLACIDLGDQIGALLLNPLVNIVSWWHEESSTSWDHLFDLQLLEGVFTLLSLSFLLLLWK